MSLLRDNQLNHIVAIIIDQHGTLLSRNEVSEITTLILENISGFETVSNKTRIQIINDIRSRYYESSGEIRR